ncbi:MAG: hypothetical protein QM728_01230 [Gordonia sp. (in: high G+C Gram-positive bacteria)]|uniref:hypothetical protein n=1 Tax=Gordonia sp. (in: high G+C Gram-positive bacteria) TaxID=84139 RepID=UPI0039E2D679
MRTRTRTTISEESADRPERSKPISRRRLLLGAGVLAVVAVLLGAWALAGDSPLTGSDTSADRYTVAFGNPNEPDSVVTSRTLFPSSAGAILVKDDADEDVVKRSVEAAEKKHVPLLSVGDGSKTPVRRELERLGASTVGAEDASSLPSGLGVTVGSTSDVPSSSAPITDKTLVLIPEQGEGSVDNAAASATATAAGATGELVEMPDPRGSGQAIDFIKRNRDARVIGIGGVFGTTKLLEENVDAARSAPELPGGGYTLFPGRRMVALYGSPGAPALGPLGRQDLPKSIDRVKKLASTYVPFSKEKVIPAFEIIVTVASAEPGPGNKYTNVIDPKVIKPWVEEAGKQGVYVTLDLQPGRVDFLTQAKIYEDLLKHPHVGLALDPEWRLKPNQVHLTQIGQVSPDEVNRVSDWLANLVRKEKLPQKLFVLHQFDGDMLGNRTRINTGHPELAVMIHADGHGTPPVKMGTWNRLITGLPPNIYMGWKNFYTEDHPTFSPERTMAVKPAPWFVSYQ